MKNDKKKRSFEYGMVSTLINVFVPVANNFLWYKKQNLFSREDHNIFCDLMGDNFFQQFIDGPTHIAGNRLDLLLCNCPEAIVNVSTLHPRELKFPSDHYVVAAEFEIRHKLKRAKGSKRLVYDYKNGDFDAFREALTTVPFNLAVSPDMTSTGQTGRTCLCLQSKITSWLKLCAIRTLRHG